MFTHMKEKEIDFKSFLIGFLAAAVAFLLIGSGPAAGNGGNSGTAGSDVQDVRIVATGSSGSFKIPVQIVDVETYDVLRVRLEENNSSLRLPVAISDIDTYDELRVDIRNQPIEVKSR